MFRKTALLLAGLLLLTPTVLYAQHVQQAQATQARATRPASAKAQKKPGAAVAHKVSDAQKIANAISAGPAEITKNATIMDWPDKPDGQPRTLRAGTNGWVCYPNTPAEYKGAAIDDPMCLDQEWLKWADAWMKKSQPNVSGPGIAYMLRGDRGASNSDPFATGATATNQWVVSPPHVMVLFQDPKMLDSYSTDPKNGGPWVMWKDTPYAHLMVPVSPTKVATMTSK